MSETGSYGVPVVLHFRGGKTERVFAPPDIDSDRQTVVVQQEDGSSVEVAFGELKAVFFLTRADTPPAPIPGGSTLAVEFVDGELIRGITSGYNPSGSGFYLFPHDRSKNDRVFVVNSAVVSIDVEKL